MNNISIISIILAIVIVILTFVIWRIFFHPIFKYITGHIAENTFSDLTSASKLIITISSASIVFTFNLENGLNKNYLQLAWVALLIAALFSIITIFSRFIHRVTEHMLAKEMESEKKIEKGHDRLFSNSNILLHMVLISFYISAISLLLGLNSLMLSRVIPPTLFDF